MSGKDRLSLENKKWTSTSFFYYPFRWNGLYMYKRIEYQYTKGGNTNGEIK